MGKFKSLVLVLLVMVLAPVPVVAIAQARDSTPGVVEINYFQYAECENVFYWQTDSEINIWAFRLELVNGGWQSDLMQAANYPSTHGMTYGIYGSQGADMAGDYVLRVYFDNGTSRAEDIAERVCEWSPPWMLRGWNKHGW